VVAVLSAGGYALYRYGYARGKLAASSGEGFMLHHIEGMPLPGGHMGDFPGGRFGDLPHGRLNDLPKQFQNRFDDYDRFKSPSDFDRGFDPRVAAVKQNIAKGSIFSPFTIALKVILFGLIVWFFYKFVSLFSGGKSWQLSFNSAAESEPEEVKPKGRKKAK
jgi:hypothetical protein